MEKEYGKNRGIIGRLNGKRKKKRKARRSKKREKRKEKEQKKALTDEKAFFDIKIALKKREEMSKMNKIAWEEMRFICVIYIKIEGSW